MTHPRSQIRAALAQPAPNVPSDEELGLIYHNSCRGCEFMDQNGFEDGARAVLARWGRPAPPPAEGDAAKLASELRHFLAGYQRMRGLDPEHIYSIYRGDAMEAHLTVSRLTRIADLLERQQPVAVPVSERQPGPKDCDAEGRCWWWRTDDADEWWELLGITDAREYNAGCGSARYTHWLSAHALPLPTHTSENVLGTDTGGSNLDG